MQESNVHNKKNSILLLLGIGTSTLGGFIYLVAINILVIKLTGSPAAVAGLWIMGPIASILTKFWSGSLVDRMNNRRLMIITDMIRAILVIIIPFLTSIWLIYVCLFFLSVARAFFEPTSMTYITSLVPQEQRKQFNSFRSLITSGAFLVGPAIAGVLLIFTSAQVAIWISAISFLISALVLYLLPDLGRQEQSEQSQTLSLKVLMNDWGHVLQFSRKNNYIVRVYFLVQLFFVMALGMDAQEVVFTQKVLGLSEADYGFLISITGIGALIGAATVSLFAKKLSLRVLMGIGFLIVALGYMMYAFSFSFTSVAMGFIILGYSYAFANTGFMTFYQNNVPIPMMGRILSVFGTFQSLFQIVFIMLIGFTGEIIPLRYSIVGASLLVLFVSILLIRMIYHPSRKIYFNEDNNVLKM